MLSSVLFCIAGVWFIGVQLCAPTFDPDTPRAARIATRLLWPVSMCYSYKLWRKGEAKFPKCKIR